MPTKRTTKRKRGTVATIVDAVSTAVTSTLMIDSWLTASPDAPPVDPTASVGARNTGRYSSMKCGVWQRWIMTDCRDDRRTDSELCDIATTEFAVSTHVVSHNGRFPIETIRAIRREYNDGKRGRIVDGPVPQWHVNKTDGTRYGMIEFRGEPDANGKRKLMAPVAYEPPYPTFPDMRMPNPHAD